MNGYFIQVVDGAIRLEFLPDDCALLAEACHEAAATIGCTDPHLHQLLELWGKTFSLAEMVLEPEQLGQPGAEAPTGSGPNGAAVGAEMIQLTRSLSPQNGQG